MLLGAVVWPVTVAIGYIVVRGALDGWEEGSGNVGMEAACLFALMAFIYNIFYGFSTEHSSTNEDMFTDILDDDDSNTNLVDDKWVAGFTYEEAVLLDII